METFLSVGHTGNQVDQLFSILASQFKSEISTIESLKHKIVSANIVPKPVCISLEFVYDWKNFISPQFAEPQLSNHSKYYSFKITKEDEIVKIRGKKLPQHPDSTLYPRAGIQILKEDISFPPVGSAGFRVDEIKFDQIFSGIRKMTSKFSLDEKMKVESSWENLRKSLESLPSKSGSLRKMNLADLPIQPVTAVGMVCDESDSDDSEIDMLTGNVCAETIEEGNLEEDITVGTDLCVFTESNRGRPWVGRVQELLPGKKFKIQWFSRRSGRGKIFSAMTLSDGSPYVSEEDFESIMFWEMSENRRSDSFTLSNFWLEAMKEEYKKLDLANNGI